MRTGNLGTHTKIGRRHRRAGRRLRAGSFSALAAAAVTVATVGVAAPVAAAASAPAPSLTILTNAGVSPGDIFAAAIVVLNV